MAGFLRSLFRGNMGKAEPKAKDISEMSVNEVIAAIRSHPGPMTAGFILPAMKRLYHIALFENHVPDADRSAAITLAEAVQKDLEAALSDNPDAIAAVHTSIQQLRELAKQGGYGSLLWMINEYSMRPADTIPFIMKPEHRELVPDYLTTFTPETLASIRIHMIRELVLQSRYEARNAVLVLHGVVAAGDKAAMALLTPDEYQSLLSVPDDYYAGRRVLEKIGLLQETTRKPDLRPASEIQALLKSVAKLIVEKTSQAESDPRLNGLSDENRAALLFTILLLRLDLFRSTLRQVYGKEAEYDVATLLSDPAALEHWHRFSQAAEAVKNIAHGRPVDWALLDWEMVSGGIEAKSEAEYDSDRSFYLMAVSWLNTERVEFLQALRSALRIGIEGEDWIETRP